MRVADEAGTKQPGEPLPDSPNPVEIAMDMERHDPAPDSPARRLLVNQNKLVLSQIASERMGVALKLLTAVAGIVAAVALWVMVWSAARTEALVVQPFSVPPELAQRGLTGEVVATRLLDGLGRLQAETLTQRAMGSYANDWGDDVQVQIPQTGVSIGELQSFLRGWLGQETNITGEVVRTLDGYTVTARTGTEPGKTFAGPEVELDALLLKASEAVYESSQPEQYAAWLRDKGRRDEASAVLQRLTISGERERRAWAFAEWAVLAERPELMLQRAERAVALDPELPLAHELTALAYSQLQQPEPALKARERAIKLLEGRRARDYAPWAAVLTLKETKASVAAARGDHRAAAELNAAAAEPTPDQPPVACQRCSAGAWYAAAIAYENAHDTMAARRMAERGGALMPAYIPLYDRILQLTRAHAREDWPGLLASATDPLLVKFVQSSQPAAEARSLAPTRAVALARLGRRAEAEAALTGSPLDCDACLRARGTVAALSGDARAADHWFQRAVRHTPSLPTAYGDWAEAKQLRGDFDGAVEVARMAQERGPRWAEAYKREGDAHARVRRFREALEDYERAIELAPRWGGAHLAQGRALAAQGRSDAARAAFLRASRLDLSAADLAEARRLTGARAAG
jgi:tetratricopeptide (TPR) repeat protein